MAVLTEVKGMQEARLLVRQILVDAMAKSDTLMVFADAAYVVKQARLWYSRSLKPALAGSALAIEAPLLGFASGGRDSRARVQWVAENQRYCRCPKHRVKATPVPILERGSLSFRAVHRWHGSIQSCRLGQVRMSLLAKFLPRLDRDLLFRLVGMRPTDLESPRINEGGGRGVLRKSRRSHCEKSLVGVLRGDGKGTEPVEESNAGSKEGDEEEKVRKSHPQRSGESTNLYPIPPRPLLKQAGGLSGDRRQKSVCDTIPAIR